MEVQRDHARMSPTQYRVKDAELVRQEADAEIAEWKALAAQRDRQRRERTQRVSTSRRA